MSLLRSALRVVLLVQCCTLYLKAFLLQPQRSVRLGHAGLISYVHAEETSSTGDYYNHRFWSNNIQLQLADNETVDSISLEDLSSEISRTGVDIKGVDVGMVVTGDRLIPIHNGQLQIQHESPMDGINSSPAGLMVCGFSPRASHNVVAPNEEERPLVPERLAALEVALSRYNISADELFSESLAGTPAARVCRSFVSPRPKSAKLVESVERAANRTAGQIELAMRQVRADQAAYYLRNTDKPISSGRQLNPVVLVLDNIRSAFNVGSLFRTSETGGVAELITTGITAHPPHPKLRKTAFSSIDVVPTRHFDDIMEAIATLRAEGYTIVAMETTSRSKLYTDIDFPEKTALVVGNEITGVDTRVMEGADLIAEIPTYGVKNSLNVASALPIVLFEVLRQWDTKKKESEASTSSA
jgi:tRNA G18 (ribose-2'-O)-methylase SpoU